MAWEQRARPASEYLHPKKQQRVLARHGRVCHLCGHSGADQVDHVVPWAEWTRTDLNVHDESNLRPAHGSPCPTCGRSCHDDKTKAEAARGRARATARRAAQARRPAEPHPGDLTRARTTGPRQPRHTSSRSVALTHTHREPGHDSP